jgi:hypothetical protein
MDNKQTGIAFLLLAVAAGLIWYMTRSRTAPRAVPNPVTTNAGDMVPEIQVSNSPIISGTDWQTPYYLRANFPLMRGAGNGAMPDTTMRPTPQNPTAQEISPNI